MDTPHLQFKKNIVKNSRSITISEFSRDFSKLIFFSRNLYMNIPELYDIEHEFVQKFTKIYSSMVKIQRRVNQGGR